MNIKEDEYENIRVILCNSTDSFPLDSLMLIWALIKENDFCPDIQH